MTDLALQSCNTCSEPVYKSKMGESMIFNLPMPNLVVLIGFRFPAYFAIASIIFSVETSQKFLDSRMNPYLETVRKKGETLLAILCISTK